MRQNIPSIAEDGSRRRASRTQASFLGRDEGNVASGSLESNLPRCILRLLAPTLGHRAIRETSGTASSWTDSLNAFTACPRVTTSHQRTDKLITVCEAERKEGDANDATWLDFLRSFLIAFAFRTE